MVYRRDDGAVRHVLDLLASWAPVQARAMFGGFGLYREGRMFALMADDTLYFKADAHSQPIFEQQGVGPFTFESKGRPIKMRYFQAPAEVYEGAEAMAQWANVAWQSALRQPLKPAKTRKAVAGTSSLPNLGPKSWEMLALAGIHDANQLRALGAVRAFLRVKQTTPKVSLNLLWALEGAISGRSWQAVARDDSVALLMALEDFQRNGMA